MSLCTHCSTQCVLYRKILNTARGNPFTLACTSPNHCAAAVSILGSLLVFLKRQPPGGESKHHGEHFVFQEISRGRVSPDYCAKNGRKCFASRHDLLIYLSPLKRGSNHLPNIMLLLARSQYSSFDPPSLSTMSSWWIHGEDIPLCPVSCRSQIICRQFPP